MKNKNNQSEKDLIARSLFMSRMERIIRETANMPIQNDMEFGTRKKDRIATIQTNTTKRSDS